MQSKPTKSGYAPVNGIELYYQIHGSGKPLVLIHGGLGQIEMFGPVLDRLAETHQVIAVDLQAHGRTLPFDRKMTFEAMAADIAGLIGYLKLGKADVMGYSLGGGVALRTAIDHPEVVARLVLVSTPFSRLGWHDYNRVGMAQIGPHMAELMKPTPIYEMYKAVAPDIDNWPKLLEQIGGLLPVEYDWSADVKNIKSPTMLIVGDYDSVRTSHVAKFFELLGGGLVDAQWDGSGMTPHRLAVLPGRTHYDILNTPAVADTALPFLE